MTITFCQVADREKGDGSTMTDDSILKILFSERLTSIIDGDVGSVRLMTVVCPGWNKCWLFLHIIWDSCWRCSQWSHIWVMIKIRHIIHSSHSSWTSTIESLLVCVVVASEYIFRVKSTAISNERISANVMNNYHRTDARPFNSEKPLSITNPKTISMMRINQFSLWKQICDKRAWQSCH